jgi:pyruvate ferredoxin oxidoreductase alpha subunit
MVCVDGFILTHAYDQVDIPSQKEVDEFLPPYDPSISLNIDEPIAIGTMVSPEYFTEVRHLAHRKRIESIEIVKCIGNAFKQKFGRNSGGLVREYNTEDAETVVVVMGSVAGTIKDLIDELNAEGEKFGLLSLISYRPFPEEALMNSLKNAKKVIVLEKAFALGMGGILSREIELTLKHTNVEVFSVVAGLGGRNITKPMLKEYFLNKNSRGITFLGLKEDVINREYSPLKLHGCEGEK